jgi:hypothetical protein
MSSDVMRLLEEERNEFRHGEILRRKPEEVGLDLSVTYTREHVPYLLDLTETLYGSCRVMYPAAMVDQVLRYWEDWPDLHLWYLILEALFGIFGQGTFTFDDLEAVLRNHRYLHDLWYCEIGTHVRTAKRTRRIASLWKNRVERGSLHVGSVVFHMRNRVVRFGGRSLALHLLPGDRTLLTISVAS